MISSPDGTSLLSLHLWCCADRTRGSGTATPEMPRVVNCLPTDAVDLALSQSEVDALLFPSDSSGASYTRKCSTSDSVATDLQLLSLFSGHLPLECSYHQEKLSLVPWRATETEWKRSWSPECTHQVAGHIKSSWIFQPQQQSGCSLMGDSSYCHVEEETI